MIIGISAYYHDSAAAVVDGDALDFGCGAGGALHPH